MRFGRSGVTWGDLVAEQKQSEQRVAGFCRQSGLSEAQLYAGRLVAGSILESDSTRPLILQRSRLPGTTTGAVRAACYHPAAAR